jgi:hypothetical protein
MRQRRVQRRTEEGRQVDGRGVDPKYQPFLRYLSPLHALSHHAPTLTRRTNTLSIDRPGSEPSFQGRPPRTLRILSLAAA